MTLKSDACWYGKLIKIQQIWQYKVGPPFQRLGKAKKRKLWTFLIWLQRIPCCLSWGLFNFVWIWVEKCFSTTILILVYTVHKVTIDYDSSNWKLIKIKNWDTINKQGITFIALAECQSVWIVSNRCITQPWYNNDWDRYSTTGTFCTFS